MALDFLRSIWPGTSQPLGGRYEIVEQLGAGGFGQTFRARDLHLPGHPLCVVKQLKPQVTSAQDLAVARRLFDTEAQVLYQLGSHPQIPRLLAHFEQNQEFYLAQELVVGHSLSDELFSTTAWNEPQVVAFLGDLLRILSFVHDHRVIHRDLKPSNLIRRHSDHRIVLIDFGAVKQASTQMSTSSTGITHTVSIGTQGYMPGEQLSGTPHFSSDLYAVGMMGIQALTGQHPRLLTPDPRTGEIGWHHHEPQATSELVDILDRMVRYDYRARYSTAREAFEALDTLPESLRQEIPHDLTVNHPARSSETSSAPFASNSPANRASIEAPNSSSMPNTYSEAPLPETQSDPAPPSQAPTHPVAGHQSPGNSLYLSTGDTGNKTEPTQVVAPGQPLESKPPIHPSVTTSVATQVVPALTSPAVRKKVLPPVAIAILATLGLITWRACAPELGSAPSASVQSESTAAPVDEPANAEQSSAPESDPDAGTELTHQASDQKPLRELLQEAQDLQQAQDYNQALARYEEAIARNESSSPAHSGRCYVLNQLQRHQEAIAACDQAISLDSGNVQAIWSKGFALEKREQPEEALRLYNQALGYDPEFSEAWNNKGTALLSLGNTQGALDAFDQAIAISPDFAEAWSNRGATLWERRQFQEGLSSVEKALQLRPEYPEASALRQEMQRRLGQ